MKKIGFIGQGFIGENLADNFQKRGYLDIVRYDLDKYKDNKLKIAECDIVFVAVPTPTTPEGFDGSILEAVLKIPRDFSTVVIKSTLPPKLMRKLEKDNPELFLMHCPEFLSEDTAQHDTDFPERNILGISNMYDESLRSKAKEILDILPAAPYSKFCTFEESTLVKYIGNCFFVVKNMYFNMIHDLAKEYNCKWPRLHEMILADSRIHSVHTNPIHKSGRGAGGHCLIKDFAALSDIYKDVDDPLGQGLFLYNEEKNIKYLKESKKDLDLLKGGYGKY